MNFKLNKLQSSYIKNAAWTYFLKIAGTGLFFIASLILAHSMSVSDYGVFEYVFSWVVILGILAKLGLDHFLIREINLFLNYKKWGLLKGLFIWSNLVIFISSLTVGAVSSFIVWFFSESTTSTVVTFWVALTLLPVLSFAEVKQSCLRAFDVAFWLLPMSFVRPLVFVFFLSMIAFFNSSMISPEISFLILLSATVFALVVALFLFRKHKPQELQGINPQFMTRTWLQNTSYFILLSGMFLINDRIDMIMIGGMLDMKSAGIYAVAFRYSQLISFVVFAINAPLAPRVASLYQKKEMINLQDIVTKSVRLLFVLVAPMVCCLVIFGYWFMFIFGEEYTKGSTVLSILSFGQLVIGATGGVGIILNMTYNEKYTTLGICLGLVTNIILNRLLIPIWGINGAAIATLASTIIWCVVLLAVVQIKMGLFPTIFGSWLSLAHLKLSTKK